jgi:predicted Zn-dependent peptidase
MKAALASAIHSPEPAPRRLVLGDGSVFLSRPTADCYGVAFGLFVGCGTRDEREHEAGIAHFTEHMVFKGTRTRSAFELVRDMEAIGAHLDAYTTKEYTAYTIQCMPQVLGQALEILRDMLLESTFPQDQLELERQVVIDELLASEDTPDDHIHEIFTARVFASHPLARPILGTQESLAGLDAKTLRDHVDRAHRGGNIVLSAAGAIGERELSVISGAFDFAKGCNERRPDAVPEPERGIFVLEKELSQQYVELGIPAVSAYSPKRYVLGLLANILGGGMSSRLFQKIREERGLAYSIYSYGDFHSDTGLLSTSFSSAPEHAQAVLDIIAEEYRRLGGGDLDDEELEMNRAQLVGSLLLGLEGAMSQMTRFARSELIYDRFLPVEELLAGIECISRHEVLELAAELLDPGEQCTVAFGPEATLHLG